MQIGEKRCCGEFPIYRKLYSVYEGGCMKYPLSPKQTIIVLCTMTLAAIFFARGEAVPSYARQTDMSCSACHTVFPQLNSYGRTFKIEGYVQQAAPSSESEQAINVNLIPPLGLMIQLSDTFTQKPPTAGSSVSNGSDFSGELEFPSVLSLFFAGRISSMLGAFVQATYSSDSGSFALDMTDIRLANTFQVGSMDLVLGITANNAPTVQDIFNSTPVWGFPYARANTAIYTTATTEIESLAGTVGGLGLYAFFNSTVYAEISVYRSAPQGGPAPTDIQGVAPFWRAALLLDFGAHSLEIGTLGMFDLLYPDGVPPSGSPDENLDIGIDVEYQYESDPNIITLKGYCIFETQNWKYSFPAGLVSNQTDTLVSLKTDVTYYYDRKFGFTAGYFFVSGTSDTLLYPSGTPVTGFNSDHIPATQGFIFELNILPWENTKFSIQYNAYLEFNGSNSDYDGSGRNAWDNNALIFIILLMY
jgi:hypothetical protein